MDKAKQSIYIKKNHHHETPAQLWIGNNDKLEKEVIQYLQQFFCTNKLCSTCITCRQIQEKQHHAITWLYPDKRYTLENFNIIFNTLSFSLENNHHSFFVIQKADYLNLSCANSLLKSIEEPPPGYHFILLTERRDRIVKTIQSRCLIQTIQSDTTISEHEKGLFSCLTDSQKQRNPLLFLRELDLAHPNEHESITLVDKLLAYWNKQYTKASSNNKEQQQKQAQDMITILSEALRKSPMPGSSKLFWKNLFLQIQNR